MESLYYSTNPSQPTLHPTTTTQHKKIVHKQNTITFGNVYINTGCSIKPTLTYKKLKMKKAENNITINQDFHNKNKNPNPPA